MKIVGITGGIASGKSTVSSYLKDKFEAYIFDADREAKELLKSTYVIDKIQKAFPNLKDMSTVSLSEEVFKNLKTQEKINKIIHPIIGDLILERIQEKKDLHNLFVVDAALIIESGIFKQFNKIDTKIILVIADKELRFKRAKGRKNLTAETIKDRIRLQMKDDEKIKYADYVVENNSSEFELFKKTDQIIEKII